MSTSSFGWMDPELKEVIQKRIDAFPTKLLVVGTGITSSGLGDERNLREFLLADGIAQYIRSLGRNVFFFLADDSHDPLTFRQLRVAVKKDETLIKAYEKYCGMPIHYIPDPYECHDNYSLHFQTLLLARLRDVDVHPTIIDTWSSYSSGLYDYAKEIVFLQYDKIQAFLKERFPTYTMKKVFWPVCPHCKKMDEVTIIKVGKIILRFSCKHCNKETKTAWRKAEGKFSWKIDEAVKWNVFKTDFEPFYKGFLDPTVGSYAIAKALSEEFFGGYVPESIQFGQVFLDRQISYLLLPSLPPDALRLLFLHDQNRKKDLRLSTPQVLQTARGYMVSPDTSFYDYAVSKLPYEIIELFPHANIPEKNTYELMRYASTFTGNFLKKKLHPVTPTKELLETITKEDALRIRSILDWVVTYKMRHRDGSLDSFHNEFIRFINHKEIRKVTLFPFIRKILQQEVGLPLHRLFYFIPQSFLVECLSIVDTFLAEKSEASDIPTLHTHL